MATKQEDFQNRQLALSGATQGLDTDFEELVMTRISVSLERFMFGNANWRPYLAVDEIEVYCDLLENLEDRINSLETRGKGEEVTLCNVQAVISSYAFEIAMKSLWALDNSDKVVPHVHDLPTFFDGLEEETVKALKRLHLTREELELRPKPFLSNRYSMEHRSRTISVFPFQTLRPLAQLLRDKVEESRKSLFRPLRSSEP